MFVFIQSYAIDQKELARHVSIEIEGIFFDKINQLQKDSEGNVVFKRADLESISNDFIDVISHHIKKLVDQDDQSVELSDLGVFYPKRIRAHKRKLRNGESILVPEKRMIGFKAAY